MLRKGLLQTRACSEPVKFLRLHLVHEQLMRDEGLVGHDPQPR